MSYYPYDVNYKMLTPEYEALAKGHVSRAMVVRSLQRDSGEFKLVIRDLGHRFGPDIPQTLCGLARRINDEESDLYLPMPTKGNEIGGRRNRDPYPFCYHYGTISNSKLQEIDESDPAIIEKALATFSKDGAYLAQASLVSNIYRPNIDKIKKAVSDGADINYRSIVKNNWVPPILRAIWAANHTEPPEESVLQTQLSVLKTLIDLGANPNQRGPEGWTPMMVLCWGRRYYGKDNLESLDILVNSGADVNIQNDFGDTVLTYALMHATKQRTHKKIVRLLEANPDLALINANGENALDIAIKEGEPNVISMIRTKMDLDNMQKAIKEGVQNSTSAPSQEEPIVRRRATIY